MVTASCSAATGSGVSLRWCPGDDPDSWHNRGTTNQHANTRPKRWPAQRKISEAGVLDFVSITSALLAPARLATTGRISALGDIHFQSASMPRTAHAHYLQMIHREVSLGGCATSTDRGDSPTQPHKGCALISAGTAAGGPAPAARSPPSRRTSSGGHCAAMAPCGRSRTPSRC